ncbi:MAG TPA: hypothetical protein VFB92_01830 [Vicinamibacterales bacterium]|jgi:hypothetical protein|nr:hypothetical protein [Vicinamibacterales bacterium]
MNKWVSLSALAGLLMLPRPAAAQTVEELAKQTQNPVGSLTSVPLQANWDFGLGDRDAVGTLFNVQPVVPFGISKSANIILRVIMPLSSQPGTADARINGLGDIVATAFFSPAQSGRLIWGAGPVFLLPAATSPSLGSEKFGIGPSVVALTQPGPWTVGILFNQILSVSGANDREDVNSTFLQPFANYNLGGGLSAGLSLEATANWKADQTWTTPLLFNISKVTLLGKRPMSFALAAGPTMASPDDAASWRFRLVATFLFPR